MRRPLLWYSVSNIGWYALVPPVAVGLLLPVGLLLARSSANPQLAAVYVDFSARLLAPAFAVWWPSFVFKERIEGAGRELLYYLRPSGEGATAFALAASYSALLVPFMLVASSAPDFSPPMMLLMLVRCFFVTSLTFCTAFVLQSSALALIIALLFNTAGMAPLEALVESLAPSVSGRGMPFPAMATYAVLSAGMLWLGEVRSRRFTG